MKQILNFPQYNLNQEKTNSLVSRATRLFDRINTQPQALDDTGKDCGIKTHDYNYMYDMVNNMFEIE